ncbi:hypothetical protein ACFYRY_37560 [Streptomyces sp. NPDC005263]|uniref:hypothetical protein n=1 Tax=Streptomyces sp. NPDC005263 TaxID=3364711 RepID=UPI0036904E27
MRGVDAVLRAVGRRTEDLGGTQVGGDEREADAQDDTFFDALCLIVMLTAVGSCVSMCLVLFGD